MKSIQEVIQGVLRRKSNIRFTELKAILLGVGFEMRQQGSGGSHYVFKRPDVEMVVVLVTHGKNDLLPEYQVKKAVKALERLGSVKERG